MVAYCHNHEVVGKVIIGYVNQEAYCFMQKWDITYIDMLGCPTLNYQKFHLILNIYYHYKKIQQLFYNVDFVRMNTNTKEIGMWLRCILYCMGSKSILKRQFDNKIIGT